MQHISQRSIRLWALSGFLLLLALLFIGGHQPISGKLFPHPWDKVMHIFTYAVLTILAGIAFSKIRIPQLVMMIMAIAAADEIHQIFVPGRHPGLDDIAADAIGCLTVLMLVLRLRKKYYTNLD